MTESVRRKIVNVAAGVIYRPDGTFLLGQRAPGTFYPGYWEFPGGKVEAGESPAEALCRELDEELGIRVGKLRPWLMREHHYEHAHVRLHFFEVVEWSGSVRDHVHSELRWVRPDTMEIDCTPMLPANGPVLAALRLPRWMAITCAAELGIDEQLSRLEAALADGLRLVQVREPGLAESERVSFAREVVARARAWKAIVLVNDDLEIAHTSAADGVHLSAARLAACRQRPDFTWVGASCHCREELLHAATLGLDYVLLGAVKSTQSHPDRAPLGWEAFADMIKALPLPVFGLGGLMPGDLEHARDLGAHGAAAIRGAWRSR